MNGDDLRYSRLGDILQVVFRMRASYGGLTLEDIAEEINAARRTAERVRDAILRHFPQIGELPSRDGFKRWGFTNRRGQRALLGGLIGFSDEEILGMEQAKEQARQRGDSAKAETFAKIIDKMMALMGEGNLHFTEDELKLLLKSEGYAVSQHSSQKADPLILELVRESLIRSVTLKFRYTKKGGAVSSREAEPCGILYNHKNYLVARDEGIIKLFDLARMDRAELGQKFTPDPAFSLQEFAQRSFGTYQEDPMDVRLLFSPDAAEDALNYHFHPSQIVEPKGSGEAEVRFRAGGTWSIMWELFRWGASVEILEPQPLKDTYIKELQHILKYLQKTDK